MDIKKIVADVVNKVKNDKDIAAKFAKDPAKTVEEVAGVKLPADQLKSVTDQVTKSLAGGSGISGLADKVRRHLAPGKVLPVCQRQRRAVHDVEADGVVNKVYAAHGLPALPSLAAAAPRTFLIKA